MCNVELWTVAAVPAVANCLDIKPSITHSEGHYGQLTARRERGEREQGRGKREREKEGERGERKGREGEISITHLLLCRSLSYYC